MGQAPFDDSMFGTGSFSMAGELIDCLMFIEDPWWVWFSMNMNTSVGFFLNQKHGASRCRNLKDFPNYSTWSPSYRDACKQQIKKM